MSLCCGALNLDDTWHRSPSQYIKLSRSSPRCNQQTHLVPKASFSLGGMHITSESARPEWVNYRGCLRFDQGIRYPRSCISDWGYYGGDTTNIVQQLVSNYSNALKTRSRLSLSWGALNLEETWRWSPSPYIKLTRSVYEVDTFIGTEGLVITRLTPVSRTSESAGPQWVNYRGSFRFYQGLRYPRSCPNGNYLVEFNA